MSLVGKTGVKQVGFQVFPEGCDGGNVSNLEGEIVPKNKAPVSKLFDF